MSNKPGQGLKDYTKNPLHGNSTQSKIKFYHLEDIVISMRQSGCTLEEIQDTLNTKYLTEEHQFVSKMSISRYLNSLPEDALKQKPTESNVNEYNELLDMLEYTESQLEIAEKTMESLKCSASTPLLKKVQDHIKGIKDNDVRTLLTKLLDSALAPSPKDVTNLMNASEKTLARRQSILADITKCKEKIFSFIAMQTIVSTLLDKVRTKDAKIYSEIYQEFNNDPLIQEAFRKIPVPKDE